MLSKITYSQNVNYDIYLSSSLYVFLNHSSVGLPFSSINFCYKHIYKEISKYKRDFSGGHKCKSTIRCDIGTTQCDNGIVKYEKKIKRTTKCGKRFVKCDVGIAECDNETIKCEEKKNHQM